MADPTATAPEHASVPEPPSPILRPRNLTLFSHGLATLSLVATLPSSQTSQTTLTFTPPTHQINDILKTLVVFADNATVTSINYPLRDLNVTPSEQPHVLSIGFQEAIVDLLYAAIGTRVSLTHPFRPGDPETSKFSSVRQTDNGVCTGILIGLQTFELEFSNHAGHSSRAEDQYVVLHTTSGHVRKILLRAVTDVAFEDPTMNRRLTDALNTLKSRVANAETPITITISPRENQQDDPDSTTTPSEVTVRYAVESPVYKLTHRLILPATSHPTDPSTSTGGEGKVLLQAWAIIDSPFPHDLHDISVSLIAGKPMSFRHDLVGKRYIERPEEVVDTGAGYGRPSLGARHLKKLGTPKRRGRGRTKNTAGLSTGGSAIHPAFSSAQGADDNVEEMLEHPMPMQLRSESTRVHTAVKGMDVAEVGDLYEYRIPHRVTLRANDSALLPVISREVEGSKVLIYAWRVHERYALSAVRLVNSGEATIEKGPVSVYEEDLLAGEGMLESLLPGKQALMPYAIDGSVSIQSEVLEREGGLLKSWYVNGWLRAEKWQEMETLYKIENSGSSVRVLYVLHRRTHGYSEGNAYGSRSDKAVVDVEAEANGDEARYKMKLGEGSTTLRVVDRSKTTQRYELESSCTTHGIAMLLSGGVVSDEAAEKMKNIMKLKADIASQDMEIKRLEEEVGRVEGDQERYRKNLTSLGGVMKVNRFKDGGVMDRYVMELEQSEDRIRQLRETIKNERISVSELKRNVQVQMLEVGAMLEK